MAAKKKAAPKKAAAKKAAPKKSSKKTAKAVAVPKVLKPIATKQTKNQIIATITEETGVARKDVVAVLGSMGDLVNRHMKKRGSGEITIPETGVKVRRVTKPRTKARVGRNPFTGAEIKIPAKPARTAVRVTALKALKETVNS
ncbi:MAG: DNA-binding protein [Proteobacteria bacterium]|nr:MAG: DNA-binding protein [Pseudomonadota bacterium]QKK11053.1 MAG: DNA-binding protein [Pseudomonadota bacterium]